MGVVELLALGYAACLLSAALFGAALCRVAHSGSLDDDRDEVLLWGSSLPDLAPLSPQRCQQGAQPRAKRAADRTGRQLRLGGASRRSA